MNTSIYKSRSFRLLAVITAVISLILIFAAVFKMESSADTVGDLEAAAKALAEKVKENDKKIKEYENKIKELKAKEDSTLELKDQLQKQIQIIEQNIDEQDELIKSYEQMIKAKENDVAVLNTSLNERYGVFLDKMKNSYENGQHGYLEMLLEADSLIDFLMRIEKIGSLLTYERDLIDSIDTEAEYLNNVKDSLTTEKTAAEEIRTSQKENKRDLNNKVAELNTLLSQINKDEKDAETQRRLAAKENEEANAKIEELLKEIAAQKTQPYVGGDYIWPLDSTYNRISSLAAGRTLLGVYEVHRGDDIPAPVGAKIYAANDGTVVTANDWTVNYSSYGNYILIDHGGGQATLYAHCSKLYVKAGQTVKRGDVIGLVGATGRVTGAHLHFEIRNNGKFTEPFTPGVLKFNYNGEWVDPTEKDANGKYKYVSLY